MKTLWYHVAEGRLLMGPQLLDVPEPAKRAAVEHVGITMVLNLWKKPDPELDAMVDHYRHIYIPDGLLRDEMLAQFDGLGRRAAKHLDEGGVVLTQCFQGRNRSGMVAAMALHHWLGISGAEAVDRVRAARGKTALHNPHFAGLLTSFPARVDTSRS